MFNKFKTPVLILIFLALFLPKPALAIFGTGLFDLFDQILGGIEELTVKIVGLFIFILFFYGLGLGLLKLSSYFLESFIAQQGPWLEQLEPITRAGWDFTLGLANMLLILIFLVIAFAFIFKIETFQARKALPKLIGVALLMNFSLLFVNLLVDIAQIFYNTILQALPPGGLFEQAMDVLINPLASIFGILVGLVGALVAAWSVPIANAFAQVAFALLFGTLLLPNLIIWVVQAIFFWSLAIMFFVFVFLFGARVFVIQLLAVLAPLAFLSLILPQTRSFWSHWIKTLLEWLLLGIYLLFFLALGFSMLELLKPDVPPLTGLIPGMGWANIGGIIIYYFALLIYLAVILFLGRKFIPQGAQGIIKFVEDAAGMAVTRGIKPGAGILTEMARTRVYQAQAERARKRKEATETISAEMEAQKRPITFKERLRTGVWARRPTPEKVFEAAEEAERREKTLREVAAGGEEARMKGWGTAKKEEELLKELRKTQALMNKAKIEAIVKTTDINARRPDWAGRIEEALNPKGVQTMIGQLGRVEANTRITTKAIEKISPKNFREKVEPQALSNLNVFYAMDMAKIREIGQKGSPSQQANLGKLIVDKETEILDRIDQLWKSGDNARKKEGDRIFDQYAEIYRNPNYPT